MPLIEWSDKLSTGTRMFDEQHKKLVAMINELHNAMKYGRGKNSTT